MKLGSMFPQSKTLAGAVKKGENVQENIKTAVTLKRPGVFDIKWPPLRSQGLKDYQCITTVDELISYIQRCEETGLGGFDYETAGDKDHRSEEDAQNKVALDPWKAEICAMSLSAAPDEARVIFIDNPGNQQFEAQFERDQARKVLIETLDTYFFRNKNIKKIAVNLAFETKFTAKYERYILMPVADPLVMWVRCIQIAAPQKIKDPKKPASGKGLKEMTKAIFGVEMTRFEELLKKYNALFFDEISCSNQDAITYCAEDSDYAVQHYLYWNEIAKQIPNYEGWLHEIEMPFTRCIGLMEYWGMSWDTNEADIKRQEAVNMQESAAAEIKQMAKDLFNLDIDTGKSGKTNEVKSVIFDYMKLKPAKWGKESPSLDEEAIIDMIYMLEKNLEDISEEKYLEEPLPDGWEVMDPETYPSLTKAQRMRIRIAKREAHPYKEQGIKLLKLLQKIQNYSTLLSSHIVGREKHLNDVSNRIHAKYSQWTETSRLNSFEPKQLGHMQATA